MTEYKKCEYHGCNQHARYVFRWYRFNGDSSGEIEKQVYSCRSNLHLAILSSGRKNPDELVNIETLKSKSEKLEEILETRDAIIRK